MLPAVLNSLAQAIAQRAGGEILESSVADAQIRIVVRIPPNAGSQWVLIVHRLLVAAERTPWKVDVSRHYFLRQMGTGQKRLFYSWRLIFQAPQVQTHLPSILDTIRNTPRPSTVEIQEMPLAGAQRNYANGKGAFAAETAPMAAHVAAQLRMGGQR